MSQYFEQSEIKAASGSRKGVYLLGKAGSVLPQSWIQPIDRSESPSVDRIGLEDVLGMKGHRVVKDPLKVAIVWNHVDLGIRTPEDEIRNATSEVVDHNLAIV